MAQAPDPFFRNRILACLPKVDLDALEPHLEMVELPLRRSLAESMEPVTHVYFLESGIASLVVCNKDDERIEVGHIGWEGLTGAWVVLGVRNGGIKAFMQVPGRAFRIEVEVIERLLKERPILREILQLFVYTLSMQVAHSALASARYSLSECLARWLLMSHDRVDGDDIPLTHEFLSLMLGVRRAGVTGELHVLEGMHIIKPTRGNIRVLDRAGLENVAGGSYGSPERIYDSTFASYSGWRDAAEIAPGA